jgi:dynein assembly factor 2
LYLYNKSFSLSLANKACIVYDAVFHPQALRLGTAQARFRELLVTTALDGIEQRFPIHKLVKDPTKLKFPNMTFKGAQHRSILRTSKPGYNAVSQSNPIEKIVESLPKVEAPTPTNKIKEPTYTVSYRKDFSMLDHMEQADTSASSRPTVSLFL